ncbi:MAG: toxin-antitoxin system YwqK family antitoxin [Bacteroidales bacterium]|nr:toxin-antitoxin system YwqK family antitoxin [Bacteroidales bacterium]
MKIIRIVIFNILFMLNFLPLAAQGDSLINRTDDRNRKQGYWERAYPNGKFMYQGYFKDDVPVGEMKRYYESGALQSILNYREGGEYVGARLFYENGSLAATGVYVNMLKDSIWNYYSYYDNTLTSKESYDMGERNGPMLYYFSNGVVSERIEWHNGIKHGSWLQYFSDGTVKLNAVYTNNMLDGDFLVYHQNGQPYVKGNYLNDQRHGLWTFYNEAGSVDMELNYLNGTCLDGEKIVDQQIEFFRMIDENKGKFSEPDENEFLMPAGR